MPRAVASWQDSRADKNPDTGIPVDRIFSESEYPESFNDILISSTTTKCFTEMVYKESMSCLKLN